MSGSDRLQRVLTLSLVAPGQRVRVLRITAGLAATQRLRDLGIVAGASLSIVQDDGNSLVLAVGATRIGVARGLAHRVQVLLEEEVHSNDD